jgi:Ras-related protein Rab-5C
MQHCLKVVVLGKASVGKTSLVSRAVVGSVNLHQQPTLGAAFSTKTVEVDSARVTLQIWDTAGQERFRSLGPMYYHGAHVALVVFDLTDEKSVAAAREWASELSQHTEKPPILYVIGNKNDLIADRKIDPSAAQQLADQLTTIYFETSAVVGTNVDDLFQHIAAQATGSHVHVIEESTLVPKIVTRKKRERRKLC